MVPADQCCRCVVGAPLVGCDSPIARIRKAPRASDYHIYGCEQLSARAREFVAMAALVSYVPEEFPPESDGG